MLVFSSEEYSPQASKEDSEENDDVDGFLSTDDEDLADIPIHVKITGI